MVYNEIINNLFGMPNDKKEVVVAKKASVAPAQASKSQVETPEQTIGTLCRNMFLENDGFCTQCGQNHFLRHVVSQSTIRFKEPTIHTPRPASAGLRAAFEMGTVGWEVIHETIRTIAEDHGISMAKVVILPSRSKRMSGRCISHKDGRFEFRFGADYVATREKDPSVKFYEYKSIMHLVPNPAPTGLEAIKWIAVHEAAHMLVNFTGKNVKGQHHGYNFQRVYDGLIQQYLS